MRKALLITDVQIDFLPGGALGVTNGHAIIPGIVDLAMSGDYKALAFSQDWHPRDHVSFADEPTFTDKSWPVHCVQNTPGSALAPAIRVLRMWAEGKNIPTVTAYKGQLPDAEAYSPFDPAAEVQEADRIFNGDLATWFHNHAISRVDNCGLALDYCVREGSLSACEHGFDSHVLLELTMPVAVTTGLRAVAELSSAGVRFE